MATTFNNSFGSFGTTGTANTFGAPAMGNTFGSKLANFGTGFTNQFANSSGGVSIWLVTLLAILFIVALIIIIVVLVKKNKKKKNDVVTIISTPLDAYDFKDDANKFTVQNSSNGLEFSYSVWIYIQDFTRGWKNILVKGARTTSANTSSSRAPGLWLYPDTNALHARINTFASPNEGCDIKNIPLQKWVHIAYVLNNRTVDMYIDGKLERSCVLRGVPKLNEDPLYVCDNGGFFGKVSNLVYYKYALNPDEVQQIYSDGPY